MAKRTKARRRCKGCAIVKRLTRHREALTGDLVDLRFLIEDERERIEHKLESDMIDASLASPKDAIALDGDATESLFELGREFQNATDFLTQIESEDFLDGFLNSPMYIPCHCGRRKM